MATIYAKASRVLVRLGEEDSQSALALETIHRAADELYAIDNLDEEVGLRNASIMALIERPWFKRVWVLQEVAAAQHVLVVCGHTEVDGYAFCAGLNSLKMIYKGRADLAGLIRSTTYLIRRIVFRPKYHIGQPGAFSLRIRSLGELVDMYHTREASDPRDKVYALL
ncbi:Heterokaryon incompatibility protein 6, OR allele, partial [Madurella mycetomatis]